MKKEKEIYREGSALIQLPPLEKYRRTDGKIEASWLPAFYNPYSKENRDLTVLAIKAFSEEQSRIETFLEPLAGICVRSIRVLKETGTVERAYASDIDTEAVRQCKINAKINKLEDSLLIEQEDANLYMRKLDKESVRIDSVDIDPYGSPIIYIESAVKVLGKGGLIMATATDVGTLTGRYPETALRRYGSIISRTPFDKELGARVLIKAIVERAASMNRSFTPLYTFYHEHYYKIIGLLEHNKREASISAGKIGYVCYEKPFAYRIFDIKQGFQGECEKLIGPIWTGCLWDSTVAIKIQKLAEKNTQVSKSLLKKTKMIAEEAKVRTPFYYRIEYAASALGRNMPRMESLIEKLIEEGYSASRTHFEPTGIRTNAPPRDFLRILSSL